MAFRKTLNGYVSRVKGEQYEIDERVPAGYLMRIITSRAFMKVWGRLLFPRRRYSPFVAGSATVRCRRKILFGKGVTIAPHVYIDALSSEGISLGNNVSVGAHTRIECTGNLRHLGKGLQVEDNVGLGSDNFFGCAGGISIGKDTIIGNFASFHAENHNFSNPDLPIRLQGVVHKGIRIGSDCWIGAKCTVLDSVVIEDGCIIAAGALVTAGIYEKNGIYGGVPAKLLKHRFDA